MRTNPHPWLIDSDRLAPFLEELDGLGRKYGFVLAGKARIELSAGALPTVTLELLQVKAPDGDPTG